MRILILAHYYPPEMGGAAARLHGLARWLVQFGHRVTVIAGFPNYPSGEIPAEYRGQLTVRQELDGVDLRRVWVYASSHKSSVRRLANYASFVLSSTLAGVATRGAYDVVIASSPPLFLGLAGWGIARLRRIPFVFDLRDLWPDVAIDAGEFDPQGFMARFGGALARFLYRRAAHLIPVTERKRQKLLAAGVPEFKLDVVPNGVDLDTMVLAADGHAKRDELGLGDAFVVLYAGLIGIAQGVEIAVAAAHLLRHRPDIRFLIVGDGVRRAELVAEAQARGLENIIFLPRQPREAIPALMAVADACLVPLATADIDDAVPSKLLEAWAFGRPVILAAAGESADIVRASGGGLVVSPGDATALAAAVQVWVEDPALAADMAARGRAYVEEHLDRRALAQQLAAVLHRVINPATKRDEKASSDALAS